MTISESNTPAFLSILLICAVLNTASCSPPQTGAGSPSSGPAGKKTLRLAIPNPPGDELTLNAEKFADAVKRRTAGAYEVRVFPGETMVKVPETYDAVRLGSVEMSLVGIGIFEGLHRGLAEYPMSYDSIEANVAAAQPLLELLSREIFEKHLNMKGLAAYTTGAQELISKRPVKTLEDWKGLLVGTGNPQGSALATAMGAAPVTVFWTDFYSSLSKGTVDAVLNSMRSDIVYRLTDSARYVTVFYAQPTFLSYNINLDVWNAMPPDVQRIFMEEAVKACDEMNAYQVRAWKETDRSALIELGAEIYDVPEAERERWKSIVQPYIDGKIAGLGELGIKIKQIMDRANGEHR
ncbi:MAG: TRAP transporter substrate-binding protein DctP [Acidobacteria bacterium]|nr:TRAP transporter substrate-binding protein DctP [Acidobacteriota bacterium]